MEYTIDAPPYPEAYGNTMDCWYTITAPTNTRIRFWVDDFGTITFQTSRFYMWVSSINAALETDEAFYRYE